MRSHFLEKVLHKKSEIVVLFRIDLTKLVTME